LPEDDLILRAARALQHASGCTFGAHISIDKQIPAQAGMGGGSSDAASTLLALNRLWNLHFSLEQLAALGLKLGADVPFFLCGQHAWVQGIGEDMTPIQLPKARLLVAKPHAGLQTASIFSNPDLKRDTAADTISGFVETLSGQPVEKFFQYGRNDLQAVVQSLCPEVTLALTWLESLGLSGRMTGSGSAVFAHTSQDVSSQQAPEFLQTRLCFNLDEHPLKGWASSERVNGGP
jgi:4-diphosphocytidyl-2-C-methyl-D-erythritol kinase